MKKQKLIIIFSILIIIATFISFIPESVNADAIPILYERYDGDKDTGKYSYGTIWYAQTFTVGNTGYNENFYVSSVDLYVNRNGSPGTGTVSIYDVDVNGKPDNFLRSLSYNFDTLSHIPSWVEFDFTSPYLTLNASTQYAIVIKPTSGSFAHWVEWGEDITPTYTGGNNSHTDNSGGTWTFDNRDFSFKVHGYNRVQSGEVPANNSIGINPTPQLYVLCNSADTNLNATWWSNSSGLWVQFASNSSASGFANNTNITQLFTNASALDTTYYWSLNLTNGGFWTNATYHFTTGSVTTNDASNVEETTATLSGSITGANGLTCGFWYNKSTTSSSDYGNNVTVAGTFDSGETFTEAVTGLTTGDYYYVRAWNYKTGINFFNSTNETYFLTKPYAPNNVSTSISENNISITWDNATINVTNRTNHVRYKITGYPTSITDGTLLYNDSTANTTMFYWYAPGVTYYFSIWTYINESGSPALFQFSDSSNNSNITATKPTDLTVTDYNDTQISLS